MTKTDLRPIVIEIREGAEEDGTDSVWVHYQYTTTDGEPMQKLRNVTAQLSAAQRTSVANVIATMRGRIAAAEAIA